MPQMFPENLSSLGERLGRTKEMKLKFHALDGSVLPRKGKSSPLPQFLGELIDKGEAFNLKGHRTSQHGGGQSTHQHFKFKNVTKGDIAKIEEAYQKMADLPFGLGPQYSNAIEYINTKE